MTSVIYLLVSLPVTLVRFCSLLVFLLLKSENLSQSLGAVARGCKLKKEKSLDDSYDIKNNFCCGSF